MKKQLDVPVRMLLNNLENITHLTSRHANQFQFAFTSLCVSTCISTVWTTRNFVMSNDPSALCMVYLLLPCLVDGMRLGHKG